MCYAWISLLERPEFATTNERARYGYSWSEDYRDMAKGHRAGTIQHWACGTFYIPIHHHKANDSDITFSFLLRSQCSLKHLTIQDGPAKGVDLSYILTIQSGSLTHIFIMLDEENYLSICCMSSSTESSDILAPRLQCAEVLFNSYCPLCDTFICMIESRWLTTGKGPTRFQRLVIHTAGYYEANN